MFADNRSNKSCNGNSNDVCDQRTASKKNTCTKISNVFMQFTNSCLPKDNFHPKWFILNRDVIWKNALSLMIFFEQGCFHLIFIELILDNIHFAMK